MSETFKQLSAVFEQAFKAQAEKGDGKSSRGKCSGCGGSGRASTECGVGVADCTKPSYQCGYFNVPNNFPFTLSLSEPCEHAIINPCPTCSKERQRLLERAKAFVWHKVDKRNGVGISACIICNCEGCLYNKNRNPTESEKEQWRKYHDGVGGQDKVQYCSSPHGMGGCEKLNPTYTVESITETLEELNEWEGFVEWHSMQIAYSQYMFKNAHRDWTRHRDSTYIKGGATAEILTNASLYAQAVTSYLKKGED